MEQGKTITTPFRARLETAGQRMRTESAGEYTLPDYQPEIRRVLRVRTRVLPSGRYRRGGRAEYAGLCVHTVLYSAGDGSLASAEVTSEYGFSFAADDEAIISMAPPTVEGVSCRLGGPRKLAIRATLAFTPHVYAEREAGEELAELAEDPDVICLTHRVRSQEPTVLTESDLGYHETLVQDGTLTPLAVDAVPIVQEVTVGERGIGVKGETLLTILCAGGTQIPETVSHRIPFETLLACDMSGSEGASASAWAQVTALDVSATPSDTGGTAFSVDCVLEVEAEMLCPQIQSPIMDLFSLKSPLKRVSESIPMTELCGVFSHSCPFTAQVSRSESDSEEACAVIDTGATVHALTSERERDGLRLSGECRVEMALALGASDPEGTLGHLTSSYCVPFEVRLPIGEGIPEDAELEVEGRVLSVRGRIEPASLAAECMLAFTVRAMRRSALTLAVGAEADGDGAYPPPPTGEIVSVYPGERDSLWSLARRYRVAPEVLAEQNGIPTEMLSDADLPFSLDGHARILIEYL